jgi:DNA-binding response OmpR family regulator/DNA-binding CsgD family transcriptional regulator
MTSEAKSDYVLIVDDSTESLQFLTDVVERTGISVLVAQSGKQALEVIEQVIPVAILMDAKMPEMDGFETCRLLKKNMLLRHVPVIFMTGLSQTEYIVNGFDAGGVDYLVKPVEPDELIARLTVHLSNAKLSQSAYVAMDKARRYLIATTIQGEILWSTPQASRLISNVLAVEVKPDTVFPEFVVRWLRNLELAGSKKPQQLVLSSTEEQQLLIYYVGQNGPDELLLRVVEDSFLITQNRLSYIFDLTQREAQVLAWITTGKTNRDIGSILNLSPRTINKHLERIHIKIGVETRTAAAAAALNVI